MRGGALCLSDMSPHEIYALNMTALLTVLVVVVV